MSLPLAIVLEVGPQLVMLAGILLTSLGGMFTAWLAYKQSLANKHTSLATDVKVTKTLADQTKELGEIKKDVNSTASTLASKLSRTEEDLLTQAKKAATAEARVEALVKEVAALKASNPRQTTLEDE